MVIGVLLASRPTVTSEKITQSLIRANQLIEGRNVARAHLRLAFFSALVLHLLLAVLLPSLPGFELPANYRASILNVFLNQDEKEEFAQQLNRPMPSPTTDRALFEPTLGAASPDVGTQALVSEATSDSVAQNEDTEGDRSAGKITKAVLPPVIRTDLAYVRMFARQEAKIYAETHPEEFEKFRRSFNNQRNYRRRNKTQAFTNRYGDYYSRTNTSLGDVCFLQRAGENRDELSTNIVYFYRCSEEPMGIEIGTSE